MDRDRRKLWFHRIRRTLRIAAGVLAWTVGMVLAVVLLVLLVPSGRRALLDRGLELADGALPGRLTVARADWPSLGRLELDGVLWADGADTLASADTLRVEIDLGDLLARDITVRQVLAAGITADVPAIQLIMPTAAPDTAVVNEADDGGGEAFFPRAGSVPPLPSLALERLALRRATVTAAPDHTVTLDSLTLGLDLRQDHDPGFQAAFRAHSSRGLGLAWRLTGHGDTDTLRLDVAPLWIDATAELPAPGELPLSGQIVLPVATVDSLAAARGFFWPAIFVSGLGIAGDTGAWTVDARLDGREPGYIQLDSSLPEAPRAMLKALMAAGTDTLAPGLLDTLARRWGRQGHPRTRLRVDIEPPPAPRPPLASRLMIDGDLQLPALSTLAPLLPPELDLDDLGPVLATVDLRYDGRPDRPRFDARVDLGQTDWIDTFYLAASGDTTMARLDSMVVRLSGLALEAAGEVDQDSLRAHLTLDLKDGSLLERWRAALPADLDPRADFRLDLVTAWPLPTIAAPDTLDPTDPLAAMPHLPSRIDFAGSVRLPPPAALGTLLPPQLAVDDLGPILADLKFHYDGLGDELNYAADLDLGRTEWLDALRVVAAGGARAARLDSLILRLPGLAFAAAGAADPDSMRLELSLDLPDSTLLRRWRDPALAGIEPRASLSLRAEGAWPLPRTDLSASFGLSSPRLGFPELSVEALAGPDTLVLELDLPGGLSTSGQDIESASFAFVGAVADSLRGLRGALRTEVKTDRLGFLLGGRVEADGLPDMPAGHLAADTLRLQLDDRGLANTRPWRLDVALADSVLEISDLELKGSLGRLSIDGRATPDTLGGDVAVALQLALETVRSFAPPNMRSYLPRGVLAADGRLAAAGSTAAPWASGRLKIAIAENEDLAGLSAETHVTLGGQGEPPARLDPGRAGWRPQSARLNFSIRDADTLLTRISALVPLPRPGGGKDSVDVRLDADSMELARLKPLLPPGVDLKGRLDSDTRAAGTMAFDEKQPDLDLSGGLRLTGLRLGMPDGSWVSMEGEVSLDGTSLAPVIRGGIDIKSGLIRIPEPPPSLLPVEGEALLWQTAAPAPDSLDASAAAAADTADGESALPDFMPDLTFTLNCPGSLWLRGQGLDVELAGDLTLRLRDGEPLIEGELEARQGTMKQLGRVFNLQRGRIIFYADGELNPELDLALGVTVSGYQITISLTGTAEDPRLEFSSSPDLTDGDIISVLLFGKTSDELDEGQSGLMAERAAQVALAYGSVQLQERLAKELGVDVLSIAPATGDSEKSSLTVGKYLNPRVMVRYEQVLSEESAFYVHLDYNLTASQEWKVHTQVSQGEASGVELKWEKDW